MTKISAINPYVNDTRETDPLIMRVPMDTMDIGARPSGLPKVGKNGMTIQHVGGSTRGTGG